MRSIYKHTTDHKHYIQALNLLFGFHVVQRRHSGGLLESVREMERGEQRWREERR